ncbi:MAG: hypothetical protein C0524_10850 [Rhodobacter sp.]|nr:hypothetical protein [Rhodobacter sp.]
MRLLPLLDRMKLRLVKEFSPVPPASPETLGFPPFGARIRDRHRRWWKEGQSHPLKAIGGKREGQDYMRALGYQVPELYAKFDHITDLPELSDLPPRIVLKPNGGHSVKNVFPIENGHNLLDRTPLSRADIIAKTGKDSTQGFLVEELLQHYDARPGLPIDYKFNCFGSRIASINVVERNSLTHKRQNRYWYLANDWALQPFRVNEKFYQERTLPPKPDCLDEMLALVRDVGARLNCFVRIDLYATSRGPVFGEFTAFPHMGYGYTPQAEAYFGAMWQGLEGC